MNRLTGSTVASEPLVPDPGFDATYGMDLDALLRCGAPEHEPADLDDFWGEVAREAAAIDPDPQMGPWTTHPTSGDHEVADLHYRSLDGYVIGGWVVRPRAGADRLAIVSHGYGGRDQPTVDDLPADCLAVLPVARGLPTRSVEPGVNELDGLHHVLWGIEEPRRYSHVGSVADLWLADTIGGDLLPQRHGTIFAGGSFGGGIGALALAYGLADVGAAMLEVPSFGNYPWRLMHRCTGSGQRVTEYLAQYPGARDRVLRTLEYVDAATAAQRVRIPVLVLPALADPSVPPPSQFAVASSLAGTTWIHVLPCGHSAWAGQEADLRIRAAAVQEFLLDPDRATTKRDG